MLQIWLLYDFHFLMCAYIVAKLYISIFTPTEFGIYNCDKMICYLVVFEIMHIIRR